MQVLVILIVDNESGSEERISENWGSIIGGDTKVTESLNVPDELAEWNVDDCVSESKIDGTSLISYGTVDEVKTGRTVLSCTWEISNDGVDESSWETTESSTTVKEYWLTERIAGRWCIKLGSDLSWLGDTNGLHVNPVTRVRVWSLSSRNDGALLQRAGVLGGIDTTEDDSTYSVSTQQDEVEKIDSAVCRDITHHLETPSFSSQERKRDCW